MLGKNISISKVILGTFLLIFTLSTILYSYYFVKNQKSYLISEYYNNAKILLKNTGSQNYNYIFQFNYIELRKNIQRIFDAGYFHYIELFDNSGISILKISNNNKFEKNKSTQITILIKDSMSSKNIGKITAFLDLQPLNTKIYHFTKKIILTSLIIWLFVLSFLIIILKKINNSIKSLCKNISDNSVRNSSYFLKTNTIFSEIKLIETNFNDMLLQISKYQKEIEQKSKLAAIGQSAAMVAHDVRKPFATVKAVLDVFDELKDEPLALERAKKSINKSIKHVETMLSDIMDFSREVKLEVEPHPVVGLFDYSIRQTSQNYDKANVSLEYDIQNKYQPLVDDERMARVLMNLMGNAVEAMKGKGRIWITSSDHRPKTEDQRLFSDQRPKTKDQRPAESLLATSNQQLATITIGNSNSHIPEESLTKIFDSFFTEGKKKGTGLGLASAKKIVELHGGTISVRNTNTGVEFIITLPTSNIEEKHNFKSLPVCIETYSSNTSEMDEVRTNEMLNKLVSLGQHFNILLLEDESLYRTAIKNTIKKHPELDQRITLYESETVDGATKLLEIENITHAIVDIDLDGTQNGYDFLRTVKENYVNLPCMVHTNRCLQKDHDKAYSLGAKLFAPKPLTIANLAEFLNMTACHVYLPEAKAEAREGYYISKKPLPPLSPPLASGLPCGSQGKQACKGGDNTLTHKKHILLINDDDGLLLSFKILLKSKGVNVTTAINYDEAMEKYRNNKFDIILSDINLGDDSKNGYEILKTVRCSNLTIPFYMVSGYSMSEESEKAYKSGASGYLQLPVNEKDLSTALKL